MGVHPRYLPGGAEHDDEEARRRLSMSGALATLATGEGLDAEGILRAASRGELKALYLLHGDSPQLVADDGLAELVLANASFVVLQTPLITPAMGIANVVLPTRGFSEKTGTLTNTEGRVQGLGRAAQGPENAHDDWEVLAEVIRRMGGAQRYLTAGEVDVEIAAISGMASWQTMGRLAAPSYARPLRQLVVNR